MANIPLNPQNVRFGEIAQRANPQASDPLQNQNTAGFPSVKPAAQPGGVSQPGSLASLVARAQAGGFPAPGQAPPVRFTDGAVTPGAPGAAAPAVAPAAAPPVAAPPAPAIDPNTGQPVEQPFTLATMEGQLDANGNPIVQGQLPDVVDIPEKTLEQLVGPNNEWLGSGPDPRTAAEKEAAANSAASQAGQPQAGKSGQTAQARDAAASAGFTVPEGSGGGKGGSADKSMTQGDGEGGGAGGGEGDLTMGDGGPPVDAPPPESDVPGQGGNTAADPDAGDFDFDDTGSPTGSPAFDREDPLTYPEPPTVRDRKNPASTVRVQKFTNKKYEEYVRAGGDPERFKIYDPPRGAFKDVPAGPERNAARLRARDAFYADLVNGLK